MPVGHGVEEVYYLRRITRWRRGAPWDMREVAGEVGAAGAGVNKMTDRELLELAAKAAGYWCAEFNCPDRVPVNWNPLEDDDDDALLRSGMFAKT